MEAPAVVHIAKGHPCAIHLDGDSAWTPQVSTVQPAMAAALAECRSACFPE